MNTVKILHCADMHIGAAESFLKSGADARRYETLITFERIIDEALSRETKIIVIAGDLFDSNRVEERFITAVFSKIASVPQIKVVFAAGNHDPLNAESPFLNLDLPKNLYVLGTKDACITFEDLKLRVYGRSFENAFLKGEERFTITPPDDGYINLMVQHGELKSDLNSDYNAITPTFVKNSGMDYIALGHVHKRSDVGRINNTFFAYSGCPEGQGFDELDEKGVYIGEIGKGICELQFFPLSKRQHLYTKIDVSSLCESGEICTLILDTLKARHGEDFRDNLYKIELNGNISLKTEISLDEIEGRLANELYFVKVKDNTEFLLDLEAISNEATLKGVFVKNLLSKIEGQDQSQKDLYKKALNLGLKAFNSEVKFSED